MIWVIFVHCLYWVGLFNEGKALIIKSLFLLEMPIMFFAIGASNSFSRSTSYINFIFRRLKRIYLPYLVYVLVCWLMTVEATGATDRYSGLLQLFMMREFPLSVPGNAASALWFLPHYCIFILIFPAFQWIHNKVKQLQILNILPYIFFIAGTLYISFREASYWNYFFAYGFWVYLGLDYIPIIEEKRQDIKPWLIFISLCSLISLLFLFYNVGFSLDMQINKFPPNIMFLCYTIFALSILVLLKEKIFEIITRLQNKSKILLEICGIYEECSFSIFLVQPFAFIMARELLNFLSLNQLLGINDYLSVVIYFILTVPIAGIMGKLFYQIEKSCKYD